MKKHLFTLYILILGFTSTLMYGENFHDDKGKRIKTDVRDAQPIIFIENGIEFLIFPDGGFDFVKPYNQNRNERAVYRRGTERTLKNQTSQVIYDNNHQIRRIGQIPIDYDRFGKVISIGTINLGYQKGNGRLRYVGGLKINYNKWGEIVYLKGNVNNYNKKSKQLAKQQPQLVEIDKYDAGYYYYNKNGKIKKRKR